jgi:hypothetical protein
VSDPLNPPAIMRPAVDLAELAGRINAEHEAGERATRRGLEHFRAAGDALLQAKADCGHGRFKAWVEKNVKVSYRTAAVYMRLAREWEKCAAAAHLRDALRMLTEDDLQEERAVRDRLLGVAGAQNEWLHFATPFAGTLETVDDFRTVRGFVFTERGMLTLGSPTREQWVDAGRLLREALVECDDGELRLRGLLERSAEHLRARESAAEWTGLLAPGQPQAGDPESPAEPAPRRLNACSPPPAEQARAQPAVDTPAGGPAQGGA